VDLSIPLIDDRNINSSVVGGDIQFYRRAPDSNNGSRRCHLHVTRFGYLTSDKVCRTLHKRDER
jgi:hypothetical protein